MYSSCAHCKQNFFHKSECCWTYRTVAPRQSNCFNENTFTFWSLTVARNCKAVTAQKSCHRSFHHSRPQSPSFLGHVVGKRGRLQIKPSSSGDENVLSTTFRAHFRLGGNDITGNRSRAIFCRACVDTFRRWRWVGVGGWTHGLVVTKI